MLRSLPMLLLLAAAPAFAQDRGRSGGRSEATKDAKASPDEMRDATKAAVVSVKANAAKVEKLIEQARNKSEPDTLKCLTPISFNMKALRTTVEIQAGKVLGIVGAEAGSTEPSAEDLLRARVAFKLLSVASANAEKAAAEAQACTDGGGGEASFSGSSTWSGGVGDDSDIEDNNQLDDVGIVVDAPEVSTYEP